MRLTLYQMVIEGPYKNFSGNTKFSSRRVFRDRPTEQDMTEFRQSCCNSDGDQSFYDIDGESPNTQVRIVELQMAEKTAEVVTDFTGIEDNLANIRAIATKLDDAGVRDLGDRLDQFLMGYLRKRTSDVADGIRAHNEKISNRPRLDWDGGDRAADDGHDW